MLGIPLGIVTILLGLKAFTRQGLPLTRQKQLTGGPAKAIGVVCVGLGSVFLVTGASSLLARAKQWRAAAAPSQVAEDSAPLPTGDMNWHEYKSTQDKFSVLFPSPPEVLDSLPNASVGKLAGRIYSIEIDQVYQITYAQFDKSPSDLLSELDVIRDRAVPALSGKLRSETDGSLGGHPSRTLVIDLPDGTVARIMVVFAGPELYQVWAIVPKRLESAPSTDRYFDSFELSPAS